MWCIKEILDAEPLQVIVTLDVSKAGKGPFPPGQDGQVEQGFCFYELREEENEEGEVVIVEKYITSLITPDPVLIAAGESTFKSWKSKNIIAKPCLFVYDEKALWEMLAKARAKVLGYN